MFFRFFMKIVGKKSTVPTNRGKKLGWVKNLPVWHQSVLIETSDQYQTRLGLLVTKGLQSAPCCSTTVPAPPALAINLSPLPDQQ
jgi:hypothetical protein